MADYTPVTSFTPKDSLPTTNPAKLVVGSELDGEFTAIATAITSKATTATYAGVASGWAQLNANTKLKPAQMWANQVVSTIIASAVTFDCATSNQFYVSLTQNITVNAPTNPSDGQEIFITLRQDVTGSRTVAWNAVFCFPAAVTPTTTVTALKADIHRAVYHSNLAKWLVTSAQNYTVA